MNSRGFIYAIAVGALALACGDAPSGEAPPSDLPASCHDQLRGPGETGVDCGGPLCAPCPLGSGCASAEDCRSGFCAVGYVCGPASCADGRQGIGEDGVDCGGTCGACLAGSCGLDSECQSGFCRDGACATPSCTDGIENGWETGLDCGGPCAPCTLGGGCFVDAHCTTGFCRDRVCDAPTCDDALQNQGETGVDCGGPCPGCVDGFACADGADCASGRCDDGLCASCGDGRRSGDESDVDCGGGCGPCDDGAACATGADCASGRCDVGGVCTSCADGVQNGDESDVDCGGGCGPCGAAASCGGDGDCGVGSLCSAGVCCEVGTHACADGAGGLSCRSDGDVATCGGRCTPCPQTTNGHAVCASGACGIVCDDGFELCEGGSGCCGRFADLELGATGREIDVAVSSDGVVHVAHACGTGSWPGVCYTRVDGASVTRTVVEASASTPALALTGSGTPRIAYVTKGTAPDIEVRGPSGGTWATVAAVSAESHAPGVGLLDLAVSSGGTPYVVLTRMGATAYLLEGIALGAPLYRSPIGPAPFQRPSAVVDPWGRLRVAYRGPGDAISFAQLGTYGYEGVLPGGNASHVALGLLASGQPLIAFQDRQAETLRLVRGGVSAWTFVTVDATAGRGRFVDVAVGPDDVVHLAHVAGSSGVLRYTHVATGSDGPGTGAVGGFPVAAGAETTAAALAIALAPNGEVVIAWRHVPTGTLRISRGTP